MATSFFDEKAILPDDHMVDGVLADTKDLWGKLKAHVAVHYQGIDQSWKYYSKKAGWSLVFKGKNSALFYFIPCEGYFKISLVFGKKAVQAAERSAIPEHIKETIAAAVPYVEGKSFFVDVKDEKDVEAVCALLKIKAGA